MNKIDYYKAKAQELAKFIIDKISERDIEIQTGFIAFESIFRVIVAESIVKHGLDKKKFIEAFEKTIDETIDEMKAPKIP